MIGWGLSEGRADRLGQPRLSEGAQPYLEIGPQHPFRFPVSPWVGSFLSARGRHAVAPLPHAAQYN